MMSSSGPRLSMVVLTLAGECREKLAAAASNRGRPGAGMAHCWNRASDSPASTASPTLHGGLVYARAVLAPDGEAERLYDVALRSDLRQHAFDHARLQLAHGAWLRRRRVTESRAPLRAARQAFDALGCAPWGERARQELRASGEQSLSRAPAARDQLLTQELQIAQMAATGMTNREIGQQLYLSPRTVGSHLYRLFPKLGVTSRSQLAGALNVAGEAPATQPPSPAT
jgi:DNA-binding CsgD family transcriptional regulator